MGLIQIEKRQEARTVEELSSAVKTLCDLGLACYGLPVVPGSVYGMIEVGDQQTNPAICVLKSAGYCVR